MFQDLSVFFFQAVSDFLVVSHQRFLTRFYRVRPRKCACVGHHIIGKSYSDRFIFHSSQVSEMIKYQISFFDSVWIAAGIPDT